MNYQSTKFWQTNFVIIFSSIALGMGWLDQLAYGTVVGVALANYAHHDIKGKQ